MEDLGNFSSIPIVDLSPAFNGQDDLELAKHIGQICHHVGFIVVTGHQIDPNLTEDVFEAAKRFFAQPQADKLAIDKRLSRHFRGWEPEGAEHTNNRPDIREQIDIWTEHPARAPDALPPYLRLLGPNQWPPEDQLPGFRRSVETWIDAAQRLADTLMGLMAISLGLERSHFSDLFGDECMSLTKIIRYPPTPEGEFGVNPHHDAALLTVLAPGSVPGLEVENAEGAWIPVPVIPNTFVINLGEIMQKMTGNYFVATPHRVVTRQARQSLGYFHGPALSTRLEPLPLAQEFVDAVARSPRHAGAGFMAQRDETASGVGEMASPHHPDLYGEQLWNYFSRSYPENVALHYPDTVSASHSHGS